MTHVDRTPVDSLCCFECTKLVRHLHNNVSKLLFASIVLVGRSQSVSRSFACSIISVVLHAAQQGTMHVLFARLLRS